MKAAAYTTIRLPNHTRSIVVACSTFDSSSSRRFVAASRSSISHHRNPWNRQDGHFSTDKFGQFHRSLPPPFVQQHAGFSNHSCKKRYQELLLEYQKEVEQLPEQRALLQLKEFLHQQHQQQQQQQHHNDNRLQHRLERIPTLDPSSNNNCDKNHSNNHVYQHMMTSEQVCLTLDAAMATFLLHVESRKAALVGRGYYTIGPCGEELLASAAHAFLRHQHHADDHHHHQQQQQNDTVALHYRHVSINLARQLLSFSSSGGGGNGLVTLDDGGGGYDDDDFYSILLDRARGYTVCRTDPVTGGVHCAIGTRTRPRYVNPPNKDEPYHEWHPSGHHGGGSGDYVVTSTLASQCPPAVGRALGFALQRQYQASLRRRGHNNRDNLSDRNGSSGRSEHPLPSSPSTSSRPISFVTIGDGSVHHSHFWSSFHLARHARHSNTQCPILFGISDNGLSISYATKGYVQTLFGHDPLVPLFVANGNDMYHVYDQMQQATHYVRTHRAPAVILFQGLVRRFGHAATDRQGAYLEASDVAQRAEWDVVAMAIQQAVEVFSHTTWSEMRDRLEVLQQLVTAAFEEAIDKEADLVVTRDQMMEQVTPPLVSVPRLPLSILQEFDTAATSATNISSPTNDSLPTNKRRDVMRKHMTRVLDEVLSQDESIVYMGEDVQHGGYYLVTDGLAHKYPGRVIDFPPDETSLLGAAMGFAQLGLLPIVEIPYAKYLDCGADMFYELAVMNWLTAGQCPNGMVIRLQGFDRGLFGGNFHTHNMLSHMPPGVDVVCFSNGEDYVRGFRHAIRQARDAKRIVMTVDCTHLLNLRHLHDKMDRKWERCYPELQQHGDPNRDMMSFDDVRRHGTHGTWAIVTFGNGVVTSLQARKSLLANSKQISQEEELDIIDCPYLSAVPNGLREVSQQYEGILFADICKDGPGSNVLSNMITTLRHENLLPKKWGFVAAPRTYNPLGSTATFLNTSDIETAFHRLRLYDDDDLKV